MQIRRFVPLDAEAVAGLIAVTMRTTNLGDYTAEELEALIDHMTAQEMIDRASWMHFYVVEEDGELIGCGAIGPFWGREDESSLFTIFVRPDQQGQGVGRRIIETLENDEFALRARRMEIPASITGTPFYLKMGYTYKDGITEPDGERLLRLEKFR